MKLECPGCHRLRYVSLWLVNQGLRFCSSACRNSPDGAYYRLMLKTNVFAANGCWEFEGSLGHSGYGRIYVHGRHEAAHRVSYLANVGTIPTGLSVLHRCDNRICVNPDHLWLGTAKDNILDCHKKGRFPTRRGEDNSQHKLSVLEVLEMRDCRARGETQCSLADRFHVHQSLVSLVTRKKKWRHV